MKYNSEVKKFNILSKDEEIKLLISAKNGDSDSKNSLIKANLKYVIQVAHRYKGMGIELEDLISFGNIGLFNAIDKFDLNNDVKFITFAVFYIRAEIKKALNDLSRLVRIPSHKTKVDNKYVMVHNLSLSDDENKKICENISFIDEVDSSLSVDINRVLDQLPEKQRLSIKMFYGIDQKPMSMDEIADEMGLSNERVRQLIRGGEKKLSLISDKILSKYL